MKVVLVLLSSLAVVTPSRRYPPYGGGAGGGLGGGAGGGFGGGAGGGLGGGAGGSFVGGSGGGFGGGGGSPIVFPGKVNGGVGGPGVGGPGVGGPGACGLPSPIGHDDSQALYLGACDKFNSPIHATFQGHNYHFSWCADGGKRYVWQEAFDYCKGLGQGWSLVNIENSHEDDFIVDIVARHRAPWIWLGGNRLNNEKFIWVWSNGHPFTYTNWGQTGFTGAPQPDNSEDNNERCVAILNQFYRGDCLSWHDIKCDHLKPTICEYSAGGGGGGGIIGGGGGGGIIGGGGGGGIVGGGGGGGGGGRPVYG